MNDSHTGRRLRPLFVLLTLFSLLGMTMLAVGAADAGAKSKKGARPTPMIFVHGQSGSAQQFESDAMRFTSNGFPQKRIFVYEYDTNESTNDLAIAGLDPFIEKVKSKTGAGKVDVLAHSRGTTVMHSYLSTPERAAMVSHYVNFDGRSSDSRPGGVPTLAVWGESFDGGPDTREIVGAKNVRYPQKSHTEVTTSKQAFGDVYKFLTGKKPKTINVLPEPPGQVTVAGRASLFPDNTGIEGGKLKVFQVKAKTGQRIGKPVYKRSLGASGSFGPFKVNGKKYYELVVSRPGESTIHNYPEPFEHDDHFYRVLSAPDLAPFLDTSPNHTNVAVTRMREFRGDQTGPGANDRLTFNGLNVINPSIAPRERRVLAVFNLDRDSDGVTDTSASLFPFRVLSFLTGVDNFMPASPDASGKIAVKEKMRDPGGQTKTTNVPNWPSSEHTVSVYFKDYAAKSFTKKKNKKGKKGK
ncbi:MAG: alpha/beta hydrolase [Thermoleophilia bacterium]|nr:alpha/beta hydrolase [Thermoleophilia bacterium]